MIKLLLIFFFSFLALSCQEKNKVTASTTSSENPTPLLRIQDHRPLMGTRFQIITHSDNEISARRAILIAFSRAREIADAATDYDPDSELNRLCQAPANTPHPVSNILYPILELALQTAQKTHGNYDPTLGPLTHLWRECRKTKTLPTPDTLAEAQSRCGWQNLTLDPHTRTLLFKKENMQLDLGGIAKGYTADLMHDLMAQYGFPRTMVAAGGDLRLGDPPPENDGWQVGLMTMEKNVAQSLTLSNCAVSTSGDLHQWIEIGGLRYSHIIDPRTGLGLTRRTAASVIAPTASQSDPLATAACVFADPLSFFKTQKNLSLQRFQIGSPPLTTGLFSQLDERR